MKILCVTPVPPSPRLSGIGIRGFNSVRALASCGKVTLVTLAYKRHETFLEDCKPWCQDIIVVDAETELGRLYNYRRTSVWEDCWKAVSTFDPPRIRNRGASELARLVKMIGVNGFDLIWITKGWLAGRLPFLDRGKVVIDLDALDHRVQWRIRKLGPFYPSMIFEYADIWKQKAFEKRLCQRARCVLVCSEGDRGILRYGNVRVLPNCVDFSEGIPDEDAENPYRLLFVGNLRYAPNVDAALFFCNSILPEIRKAEPEAHVYIVGREPLERVLALHTGRDVIVTGTVPDVTPYFKECGVIVVPLRAGGGTRVKILEAFAHEKAVVSTRIGAEGLQVEHGVHLCLADDPLDFASHCVTLMRDSSVRRTLGVAARQLVENKYSLSIFQRTVRELVAEVSRSQRVRSAP